MKGVLYLYMIRVNCLLLLFLLFSVTLLAQSGAGGVGYTPRKDSTLNELHTHLQLTNDSIYAVQEGEKNEKTKTPKEITPKRIALLSLAAPGIGQIYNKKFWKLPIVYGLIGTGAYFTGSNAKELRKYNTALNERFDSTKTDQFEGIYTTEELYAYREYYQRNVEISAILTGLAWGLQIVDAVVDAHLKKFDISDDLSLQIKPTLLVFQQSLMPGISFRMSFR